MDVLVERFQRRKIVSDKDSPMLFYLRQNPALPARWMLTPLPPVFRRIVL